MLSKNEGKYIQSLCHKKQRDQEGLFIAEGPKLVAELLSSNMEVVGLYGTAEFFGQHPAIDVKTTIISTDELSRISNLQTPNQVLAIVKQRQHLTEPTLTGRLTLVLDAIQDPGNLGTIIRIADWFGITQVVAGLETADIYNPKVVQASMGSICRVGVWYEDLLQWLPSVKVPVYGALLDGESIYGLTRATEGVLLIGNEGKGIHEALKPFINRPVTIPRFGGAESLNAAVATGIIVSHLIRD
ncbi:RNA methyltransferase [Segetibacter sp. 3557_3]|uniref:TrmH family RNA methyltransferase n=1 Tax=Segetibacter sp. 3557_3 TaxID=2547429 RepID=UPI001058D7E1|nr:RNA methyltransferase [Segetibacter sp. 3557_3]TDH24199.1 RNA methyltransferase [Segetibacter sp. 3557_3]